MEENLIEVFTADQDYKVSIIRELLDENGIESYELDKKGSALLLGEISVFVDKKDEEKARHIIANHDI